MSLLLASQTRINYGLVCSAGSYTLTGNAAALKRGYALACAAGSYAILGNQATLKRSYTLTATAGAYTYAGQAATLKLAHTLTAAAGSYAVSGYAATLTYTPGASGVNYTLTAGAGIYAITGNEAVLLLGSERKAAGIPRRFWAKRKVTITPPDDEPIIIEAETKQIIEKVKAQARHDALLTVSQKWYNHPQQSVIVSIDETIQARVQLIYQAAFDAALRQRIEEIDEEEAILLMLL